MNPSLQERMKGSASPWPEKEDLVPRSHCPCSSLQALSAPQGSPSAAGEQEPLLVLSNPNALKNEKHFVVYFNHLYLTDHCSEHIQNTMKQNCAFPTDSRLKLY